MNGTVIGGWGFVSAAYTITAVMLGAYAIRVIAEWKRHTKA